MMKTYCLWCMVILLGCAPRKVTKTQADGAIPPREIMAAMQKTADWQLAKIKDKKKVSGDWTYATLYAGFLKYALISGNKTYLRYLRSVGDSLDWNTGRSRFHADDYCIGQTYAQLSAIYKAPEMIRKFRALADSIVAKPHTEPLEFKNNIVYREWAWCDALFMGPPALAYLSTATGDAKYLETADKLWWKTTDYLFDTTENLYYRDSRYFHKREANGQKVFWSRGNGWVMGGLVRMMDNMPKDYTNRPAFENLFKKMAKKIASLQTADGTWHAALLDTTTYTTKETSGTGFYCYALAWGIRKGLLPYKEYFPVVSKAWQALLSCVHPDGKLGFVQQIGAAPDKTTYDDTEVYGVGALLLAGCELYALEKEIK